MTNKALSHGSLVPATSQEAINTLIQVGKQFYQNHWMSGTSGNLSIRISRPEQAALEKAVSTVVITGSGHEKGDLGIEDFLVLSLEGETIEATVSTGLPKIPSAETLLHCQLYQLFPQVHAVYHVHTVAATALSRLKGAYCYKKIFNTIEFENLEMLKGLGAPTHLTTVGIPVLPNSQDMKWLARQVKDVVHSTIPGVLIEGHGLYAWGNTPAEAKRHIEIWEFLFQLKLLEYQLKPLSG